MSTVKRKKNSSQRASCIVLVEERSFIQLNTLTPLVLWLNYLFFEIKIKTYDSLLRHFFLIIICTLCNVLKTSQKPSWF